MSKRRNHDAGFKARMPLEAGKGERAVSELAAVYGVQTTLRAVFRSETGAPQRRSGWTGGRWRESLRRGRLRPRFEAQGVHVVIA